MLLKDGLLLAHEAATRSGASFEVQLLSGFTPLHFPKFLAAHLAGIEATRRVLVTTGSYGDLIEAVRAAKTSSANAIAIVVEYADLDPRLGLRRLGGWGRESFADSVATASRRLDELVAAIQALPVARVVVALPSLPLPPIAAVGRWQVSGEEIRLQRSVWSFAEQLSGLAKVVVCSPSFDDTVPGSSRRDVKSDYAADYPYTIAQTSAVASALAANIMPRPVIKGIITDLDDTMWRGLVGEVGADGVSWDLDHKSQTHAVYQQLLNALGERGILIAIASKNDPAVVAGAMARSDLILSPGYVFPSEVSWGPKSEAVARIVKAWNIGMDAVAFIDDNPLELAEVHAAHPAIHTFQFPTLDDTKALALFANLRDLCHKETVTAEDGLRVQSLRAAVEFDPAVTSGEAADAFLSSIGSSVETSFIKDRNDARALELVNKTNQFNLNGERVDPQSWQRLHDADDGFIGVVSYKDKFGPLGKIGVVFGSVSDKAVRVDGWVLSCRAFSRRVEHATIEALFSAFGAERIEFAFKPTERNGPTQDFMSSMGVSSGPNAALSRADFDAMKPKLYHAATVHAPTMNGLSHS